MLPYSCVTSVFFSSGSLIFVALPDFPDFSGFCPVVCLCLFFFLFFFFCFLVFFFFFLVARRENSFDLLSSPLWDVTLQFRNRCSVLQAPPTAASMDFFGPTFLPLLARPLVPLLVAGGAVYEHRRIGGSFFLGEPYGSPRLLRSLLGPCPWLFFWPFRVRFLGILTFGR